DALPIYGWARRELVVLGGDDEHRGGERAVPTDVQLEERGGDLDPALEARVDLARETCGTLLELAHLVLAHDLRADEGEREPEQDDGHGHCCHRGLQDTSAH